MGLVVDVEPVGAAGAGFGGDEADEFAGDAAALELGINRSVEEEGVGAAVPGDVDVADDAIVGMLWCSAYQTRAYPCASAVWASATLAAKLSLAVRPGAIGARSRMERGMVMLGATAFRCESLPGMPEQFDAMESACASTASGNSVNRVHSAEPGQEAADARAILGVVRMLGHEHPLLPPRFRR